MTDWTWTDDASVTTPLETNAVANADGVPMLPLCACNAAAVDWSAAGDVTKIVKSIFKCVPAACLSRRDLISPSALSLSSSKRRVPSATSVIAVILTWLAVTPEMVLATAVLKPVCWVDVNCAADTPWIAIVATTCMTVLAVFVVLGYSAAAQTKTHDVALATIVPHVVTAEL